MDDPGSLVFRSIFDGKVRYSGGGGSLASVSICLRDAKAFP